MSIIRVGLAETKNFSEGYDRIFGKKTDEQAQAEQAKTDEAKQEATSTKKDEQK